MNNVNLAGWSAGGHIAFQYALNQGAYNDASCQSQGGQVQLRKVLSVAGATDLIRVPVKTILTGIETNLAYFVGAKKGTDAYLQRMRDNSPIDQLGKSNQNIEYYLYHAPDDTVLNYDEQFSPMYKAMKDRGYNVFTYTNFSGHDANTIPESAIRSVITQ